MTTEIKLTYQAELSWQLQRMFGYKYKALVTQETGKRYNSKTQTTRRQSWRLYLRLSNYQLCGGMMKLAGYSIGIAQIDDEIKEKVNFRICQNSTISLLVSRSDMPKMRCFSIGGLKNQHDAILQSIGTTEEIIISLTRLPSSTYSLLSSSLSYS